MQTSFVKMSETIAQGRIQDSSRGRRGYKKSETPSISKFGGPLEFGIWKKKQIYRRWLWRCPGGKALTHFEEVLSLFYCDEYEKNWSRAIAPIAPPLGFASAIAQKLYLRLSYRSHSEIQSSILPDLRDGVKL